MGWIVSGGEVLIFYSQKMERFVVEQNEERKSIRRFCEGYCLWYYRECEDCRRKERMSEE